MGTQTEPTKWSESLSGGRSVLSTEKELLFESSGESTLGQPGVLALEELT